MITQPSSWDPVNLEPVLSGDYVGPQPSLLARTDGESLLYRGALHSFAGPPGSGKTFVALVAAAHEILAGRCVLYLDFEDSAPPIVDRLKMLGVPSELIPGLFGYVDPDEPLPVPFPERLLPWVDAASLIVLDGVTEAMARHGLDPLSNRDAAHFMQTVIEPLLRGAQQPAVVLVDHVTKAKDRRGRYSLGAQHKTAAVQVQFTVETRTPFDQDNDGAVDLLVAKDRYGQVQRLSAGGTSRRLVSTVKIKHAPDGSGQLRAYVDPPAGSASGGAEVVKDLVLQLVQARRQALTLTDIKAMIRKRDSAVADAVRSLEASGRIRQVTVDGSPVWEIASTEPMQDA